MPNDMLSEDEAREVMETPFTIRILTPDQFATVADWAADTIRSVSRILRDTTDR